MGEEIVLHNRIENNIYVIRGQKVLLDIDLAMLYEVETKYLNRQVKRNRLRFPDDFMFQLTKDEHENMKSQIVTSNLRCQNVTSSHGGARYHPYAFTEHGIAMLSSVLNSKRAILVNIQIMRTFSRLRQIMSINTEFGKKFDLLEKRVFKHDSDIRELARDIRKFSVLPGKVKKIGFLR